MREKILDKRLQAVVSFVEKGDRVADIGSDHGYIPLYLIQNNICENVLVTDINEGPLLSARKNFERFGFGDFLNTMLYDGIDPEILKTYDKIIIAGMGGLTIAGILEKVESELKEYKPRLILQPMTEQDKLRKALFKLGYRIEREKCPEASGKIYNVIYARSGEVEDYKELEYALGKYTLCDDDDKLNYIKKLDRVIKATQSAVSSGAKNKDDLLSALKKYREEIA